MSLKCVRGVKLIMKIHYVDIQIDILVIWRFFGGYLFISLLVRENRSKRWKFNNLSGWPKNCYFLQKSCDFGWHCELEKIVHPIKWRVGEKWLNKGYILKRRGEGVDLFLYYGSITQEKRQKKWRVGMKNLCKFNNGGGLNLEEREGAEVIKTSKWSSAARSLIKSYPCSGISTPFLATTKKIFNCHPFLVIPLKN